MVERASVIVLGAGVAGLAAAWELGDSAIVLEQAARPGGLVRTERRGGFWFDHVLHLLYFADSATELRIRELLGDVLAPCTPEAWVETRSGVARYPLQMHLATLAPDTVVACLRDLAACTFGPHCNVSSSFEALLLATFGSALCDEFLFPYNRKVWKRPLSSLAPSGFQWNITSPRFDDVVRGAISDRVYRGYNAAGFYPRPPRGGGLRGMEVLSHALATRVSDLRLEHRVLAIDLDEHVVVTDRGHVRFETAVVSTLPLPLTVAMCVQAPPELRARCRALAWNRVTTVALAVVGPRPSRGHWRYFADESLCFNRIVYLHEFDPELAPPHGFGILAEITECAESPREPDDVAIHRVVADLARCDALPAGCEVVDAAVVVADPAYVVFDREAHATIAEARAFLLAGGVRPLGRYGRWEYSSMAQVMRDGFVLGREMRGAG
jgi:protoporphyrinogen oxidase